MVSSDKDKLSNVSPDIKEIYERALSHEPGPPTVYKCKACKDDGWIDTDTGMVQCKCLITKIKMEKYQALMKECRISKAGLLTFDRYEPKNESQRRAKDAVMAFKRGPKGYYLVGNMGVGKTHLMTALAQHVIDELKRPAIVWSAAVLLDNLLAGSMEDKEEKFRQVVSIPFLVIDDIGKERKTEAVMNKLWSLINERYNAFGSKVTCFTSSYQQEQLARKDICGYPADLADRIRGLADEIIVTGPSGR